jgi:hypothetical protein
MNLAEPITIGKIWRNRYRTEFICVAIKQYEGAAYLDVRVWRQDVDGRSRPTDKAITIGVRKIEELGETIAKAIVTAKKHGLIRGYEQ